MTQPTRADNPVVQSLWSATLLSVCAGMMDAFVYLNHGHVFASAMTGNGALLGIAMLRGDWTEIPRHISPMAFFVVGVALSRRMQRRLGRRAASTGVLLEMLVLAAASFLPLTFPEIAYTALLAFVASYQVSGFRTVNDLPYSSTYITGDLRTVGDGLFELTDPRTHAAGFEKLRDLSLVVAAFVAGAAAGAMLAPHFLNHTLWFLEPMLLVVLLLALRSERQTS